MSPLRTARWLLGLTLGLLLVGLVGLSLFARQETSFVIRGRSMEPTIPIGSLVSLEPVTFSDLRAGDVVTVRADNGVVVTHRVLRMLESGGEGYLELKGDANESADPALVPARVVEGRVAFYVPFLGFVVALMSAPSGFLSVLSLVGAVILLITFLQQLEDGRRRNTSTDGLARDLAP